MAEKCLYLKVAARNGQEVRSYPLKKTGRTIEFTLDRACGKFLFRYEQDANGNPTDPEVAEDMAAAIELMAPPASMPEKQVGSGLYSATYGEGICAPDYRVFGQVLARMEEHDFERWLKDNSYNIAVLEDAKRALQAVGAAGYKMTQVMKCRSEYYKDNPGERPAEGARRKRGKPAAAPAPEPAAPPVVPPPALEPEAPPVVPPSPEPADPPEPEADALIPPGADDDAAPGKGKE